MEAIESPLKAATNPKIQMTRGFRLGPFLRDTNFGWVLRSRHIFARTPSPGRGLPNWAFILTVGSGVAPIKLGESDTELCARRDPAAEADADAESSSRCFLPKIARCEAALSLPGRTVSPLMCPSFC